MYLKIKNESNEKNYTLTSDYAKPYVVVRNGDVSSVLPLTPNTTQGLQLKVKLNDQTYRAMEYVSASGSSSGTKSASASYLTSSEGSAGMSSTTALTRASTSGTSYYTRASTSATSYLTRQSTSDTVYGTSTLYKTFSGRGTFRSKATITRNTLYVSNWSRTASGKGSDAYAQWTVSSFYGNKLTYQQSLGTKTASGAVTSVTFCYNTGSAYTAVTGNLTTLSGTTYKTRVSTSDTIYYTQSSTSATSYWTRSSTSGYSGVSSSSSSMSTSSSESITKWQ